MMVCPSWLGMFHCSSHFFSVSTKSISASGSTGSNVLDVSFILTVWVLVCRANFNLKIGGWLAWG